MRVFADKMTDSFDPYYNWLGIPAEEQPADYYRLLGIRRYEDSASVISDALDQKMGFVRTCQLGPRAEITQRILNELARAGVCLLNPERKAPYDAQLRREMQTPVANTSGALNTDSHDPAPRIVTGSRPAGKSGRNRRRKFPLSWAVVVACTVVVTVLIAIAAERARDQQQIEDGPSTALVGPDNIQPNRNRQ